MAETLAYPERAMTSIFPQPIHHPSLPPFKTLLMHGSYHPSAPVHLCLSHTAFNATDTVLLIAPSRDTLLASVEEFGDGWLKECGGHGATSRSAMRIQMLYPSSAMHLALLLSSVHGSDTGGKASYIPKTTLSTIPSLIVLCELSSYVSSDVASTVSSYLLLVIQTLASVKSLSSDAVTSLVIFDSGLQKLRLPIVRPPSPTCFVKDENVASSPQTRTESVLFLASRFFEWVGVFEAVDKGKSGEDGLIRSRRLTLQQSRGGDDPKISWNWMEHERRSAKGLTVTFVFE